MSRICTLCGAEYPSEDTAKKCIALNYKDTYCGGEIQPPPYSAPRQANCLVCMDTGIVEVLGEIRKCPRMHEPKLKEG